MCARSHHDSGGKILPVKILSADIETTSKYKQIAASMREIGIIEPLMVHPHKGQDDTYILLDGHLRLSVAKEAGEQAIGCLVAHDDEAFTYNHKVNRLSAIQEHFMILKAIANGVSEQRIAKTLNIDLASIRKKRDLLEGICPEAVDLLKDRRVAAGAIREIRKVKPIRQIEMSELMIASNNYSHVYAECLFAATPKEQLIDSEKEKEIEGLTTEDVARMEREMENLGRDFAQIEDTHGRNTLHLTIVVAYIKRLLDNARVVRYLSQHHSELLIEFQKLAESKSVSNGEAA